MRKIALLILVIGFSFSSCEKTMTEGIIVEKRYTPALTYGVYGPPYDEYILKVETEEKRKPQKHYVSKEIYDHYEVGDMFPFME